MSTYQRNFLPVAIHLTKGCPTSKRYLIYAFGVRQQQTYSGFVSYQYERCEFSELPYLWNYHWTRPSPSESSSLSNWLASIQTFWNIHIRISGKNAKQNILSFWNFWYSELSHGVLYFTDGAQQTQAYCGKKKKRKKSLLREIKNIKWRKFKHCTLYD